MHFEAIVLREEHTIRLPTKCPKCGGESLVEFPVIVVATALTKWNHMALRANCCRVSWNASDSEIQQIKEYLGEPWILAHQAQSSESSSPT